MHAYEGSQSSFLNSMYRPNSALQPTNNQSYTSYKPQTDYPMAVRFDTHPLHSLSAYNSGSFSFYPCASSHRYVHDLNCSYTAGTLHSGEANSQLFYFSLALNLNSLDKKPIIKPKSLISRVLFFCPHVIPFMSFRLSSNFVMNFYLSPLGKTFRKTANF